MARDTAQAPDELSLAITASDGLSSALLAMQEARQLGFPTVAEVQHRRYVWNAYLRVNATIAPLRPPERPNPLAAPVASDVTDVTRRMIVEGRVR